MNYYISDLHFGHNNAIRFDNRPFNNMQEMESTIVENWNKTVKDNDIVYVLGDLFWKTYDADRILPILNGQIILIKGNHDSVEPLKQRKIQIFDYLEIKDNKRNVVLSHYPIPSFNKHYYPNNYHLYGHVHNSWEWKLMEQVKKEMNTFYDTPCEMYNVGCMLPYMDYTPRTLDEIILNSKKVSD